MSAARGPRSTATGLRLARALLAYMLAVTLLVTLLPFRFGWPEAWRVTWFSEPIDAAANVLLFVPFGFLVCFARQGAPRYAALGVLTLGAALSLLIEAVQLFEAGRDTTALDVAANAFGAWLGALAYGRIARAARLAGRIIGWLELELPLMALVYLLVPLLWINSLASQGEAMRGLSTLLIGTFGAILLGGIQRNYFGPAGTAKARDTALFAAMWFVAGAFPTIAWRPAALIAAAVAVALLCWWQGAQRALTLTENRRFESRLLSSAAPVYAGFLAIATLAPLAQGVGTWSVHAGFPETAGGQREILRFLELIAAYTLVGYMVAEFRGRAVARYRDAAPRLAIWGLLLGLATEGIRGYELAQSASVARGAVLAATVLYGGWLYYLQRAHVVQLIADAREVRQPDATDSREG